MWKINPFRSRVTAIATASLALAALTLTGCSSDQTNDGKTIKVATSPGPYSELFKEGVDPILKEKGYKLEYKNFSDLQQADVSVKEKQNDLIVDQHTAYMQVFNDKTGANLASLTEIPTVPASLFSKKHPSMDDVSDGQSVGIPLDASNQSRAYNMLADAGWITLKADANKALLTAKDVETNKHNLEIKPMDSAQLPRTLDDLDWAVIPGSISYSSKVDMSLSRFKENLRPELILVAVTRQDEVDKDWAKAVTEAYQSTGFKDFMTKKNSDSFWFVPTYK